MRHFERHKVTPVAIREPRYGHGDRRSVRFAQLHVTFPDLDQLSLDRKVPRAIGPRPRRTGTGREDQNQYGTLQGLHGSLLRFSETKLISNSWLPGGSITSTKAGHTRTSRPLRAALLTCPPEPGRRGSLRPKIGILANRGCARPTGRFPPGASRCRHDRHGTSPRRDRRDRPRAT